MREKKLHSKKNEAYLVEDNKSVYIKKVFSSADALFAEEKMLKILDGESAPKLISADKNYLCIEFIEGLDFVDLLMLGDNDTATFLGKTLAEFFKYFYKKTTLILTDENLHHYIFNKEKGLIRIDLEDYKNGTLDEWATKLCAFSILYDGIKVETVKVFLNAFLQSLNFSMSSLKEEIKKEAQIILIRRNRNDFDFSLYLD